MRVCIDTNVLLQLFGKRTPYSRITNVLQQGRLEFAVSNEIWLEYEETITHLSGKSRWQSVESFFQGLSILRGNVLYAEPQFRFRVVHADPDDDKFVDCAIAVGADFIITFDHHFSALIGSGYKPMPITPDEFIAKHL